MNRTQYPRQSIGKAKAIALYDSGWWKDQPPLAIARFQLFTDELCVPFGVFHEAIEKALGRPVWTHEFALNYEGLAAELMEGKKPPTIQQIIELIPEDKRIVIQL